MIDWLISFTNLLALVSWAKAVAVVCSLHSWARVGRHWGRCCMARACSRLKLLTLTSDKCSLMAVTTPLGLAPLVVLWWGPTLPLAFGTQAARQWWQSGAHGVDGKHGRVVSQEVVVQWCHCLSHPRCPTQAWYLQTLGRGAIGMNSHQPYMTTRRPGCGWPQNWRRTHSWGWSSRLAALELSPATYLNMARGTPCAGHSRWHAHCPRLQGPASVQL